VPELTSIDALFDFMKQAGQEFDAEPVDVCSHGLQCAALLDAEAPDDLELQIAGLFHDLGSALAPGRSATHARTGAAVLAPLFGMRVARLVTGHDDAKRYLVTTEANYRELLSPRSLATLRVQGGLMDPVERAAFERRPDFEAVLTLRRADDRAKVVGLQVPGLAHWRARVEAILSPSASRS
jgi:predicted HD phosphohydrolase